LWYIGPGKEVEIYNDKIFLIHDQDTSKPRSTLYAKMMKERYEEDPTDCWNNWFLLNHYYKEKDLMNYLEVAVNYVKFSEHKGDKYNIVMQDLASICKYEDNLDERLRQAIAEEIGLM
jgi:hypothetical protein